MVFLVCYDLVPLSQPAPIQCFTPTLYIIHRCASTHFEENQLAPSSTGISPLLSIHPSIFQHRAVQTSTSYHQSFILIKSRSPGFGSRRRDKCPIQTRFHCGFSLSTLTRPLLLNRWLILQQARCQHSSASNCL